MPKKNSTNTNSDKRKKLSKKLAQSKKRSKKDFDEYISMKGSTPKELRNAIRRARGIPDPIRFGVTKDGAVSFNQNYVMPAEGYPQHPDFDPFANRNISRFGTNKKTGEVMGPFNEGEYPENFLPFDAYYNGLHEFGLHNQIELLKKQMTNSEYKKAYEEAYPKGMIKYLSVGGDGNNDEKKSEEKRIRVPALIKGSEQYEDLRRKIAGVEKSDKFNAVDPEVIRISLLHDMLPMEAKGKIELQMTNPHFIDRGLFLFYNPTCPKCQDFAPVWAQLARVVKNQCGVGMVNCSDKMSGNDILADYLSISGYPTIKFYDKGEFTDYTGGKSLNELLSFVCEMTGRCQYVQ